jgi:hypothetical protein
MSTYDKKLLAWKNLDLYEVLRNMPRYDASKDLVFNFKMPTAYAQFKDWLTSEDKLKLNQIVLHVELHRLPTTFKRVSPKQWHCEFVQNNPVHLPSHHDVLHQLEKDSFNYVIWSQQASSPQTASSTVPHTVVVAITCHGAVYCVDNTVQNIPMYTVPAGKTVTIISVATPGAIELNKHTNELLPIIRKTVSSYNISNDFIPPDRFTDVFTIGVTRIKKANRQFALDNKFTHMKRDDVDQYLKTWTEPRCLYFNEGDECVDKSYFNYTERTTQLLKFNLMGWDQELMPPFYKDKPYRLSEMCEQLFFDDQCTNIVIIDWSCSVLKNVSDESYMSAASAKEHQYTAETNFMNGGRF